MVTELKQGFKACWDLNLGKDKCLCLRTVFCVLIYILCFFPGGFPVNSTMMLPFIFLGLIAATDAKSGK